MPTNNTANIVNNDDILYILGDLGCYKDLDLLRSMLQRINGRKFVIIGNHDSKYNLIQLVKEKVIEKEEVKEKNFENTKTMDYTISNTKVNEKPKVLVLKK